MISMSCGPCIKDKTARHTSGLDLVCVYSSLLHQVHPWRAADGASKQITQLRDHKRNWETSRASHRQGERSIHQTTTAEHLHDQTLALVDMADMTPTSAMGVGVVWWDCSVHMVDSLIGQPWQVTETTEEKIKPTCWLKVGLNNNRVLTSPNSTHLRWFLTCCERLAMFYYHFHAWQCWTALQFSCMAVLKCLATGL